MLLLAACAALLRLGPLTQHPWAFLAWFSVAVSVYLIAVWWSFGPGDCSRAQLRWILAAALLLRVVLLPVVPTFSTSLAWVRWEGKILSQGFNPYQYAPASGIFDPIRTGVDREVAHAGYASVTPPLAERMMGWDFGAVRNGLDAGLRRLKWLWVGFDLATILLLLRMLRRRGLPRRRVLAYAWAPLVLLEIAGQGQPEIAAVFFVVLALEWGARGKPRAAALAFVSALGCSWFAWLALPAWLNGMRASAARWRNLWPALAWGAVFTLPYFLVQKRFGWWMPLDNLRGWLAAFRVQGAAHWFAPWMALWLTPWLVLRPSLGAFYLTFAAVWAYLWGGDAWTQWLLLAPALALFAWDLIAARRRRVPAAAA